MRTAKSHESRTDLNPANELTASLTNATTSKSGTLNIIIFTL